ncbi:hypothetical protein Acr_08g0011480 [Actinidia rufa]|uniref:Uncharacterized protein n=1 Tax=Actinidia rufa TaxID=165716 RepID=A0A7J0F241_9ERIC|nr:hypothetical protein Acr_08g0011480 [Actinidia rufa]
MVMAAAAGGGGVAERLGWLSAVVGVAEHGGGWRLRWCRVRVLQG